MLAAEPLAIGDPRLRGGKLGFEPFDGIRGDAEAPGIMLGRHDRADRGVGVALGQPRRSSVTAASLASARPVTKTLLGRRWSTA
jgi:hypothetical protein